MKTVDQQVFDYIENQKGYELITSKGITINTRDECLLHAEFVLADTADASLYVSFCCDKSAFVKALGIQILTDIYQVTKGSLTEMFYEGLAELVCFVALEYTYCMSFQKLGSNIIAENERGVKHTIPIYEKLETPGQFVDYARRYYKMMELHEN